LPKAKTVLPVLEFAAGHGLSMVRLAEALPGPAAWASLPVPRPKISIVLLLVLGSALLQFAPAFRPRAALPALSSCRRSLEVLRC
jgi:hypothetical protein